MEHGRITMCYRSIKILHQKRP